MKRRDFLNLALASAATAAAAGEAAAQRPGSRGRRPYRIISCEESFTTPDIVAEASRLAGGVPSMTSGLIAGPYLPPALELGDKRIALMDADGVDVQLLAPTGPGVQHLGEAGVRLARETNDYLAGVIARYPTRYAGMVTCAPQNPAEAVKEIQRAIRLPGFKGVLINSHTNGEYLHLPKYWPILEVIEDLDVPLYIHPRDPIPGLAAGLRMPGFSVGWGYGVETGTHALQLIGNGIFDRFPKLRIVLGHMGESIPFLLDRIDNRYVWETNMLSLPKTKEVPSAYFRRNFWVTTAGMNYEAPLVATLAVLGEDRVLFAADYPMEVQKDAVDGIGKARIPASVKRKIFETNPARVFRI